MQPHRVISTFRHGGGYIKPPGFWTPPDEATAARLVAARCLAPPKPVAEAVYPKVSSMEPPKGTPKPKRKPSRRKP